MAANKTVSPDKVGVGKHVIRSKGNDTQDQQEKLDYERHKAVTDQIKQANQDAKANRQMREAYANSVFWYLVGYSVFAGSRSFWMVGKSSAFPCPLLL